MIGIYGSEEFARSIKARVSKFLRVELKLELSLDKIKLTNLHTDKGEFLGFYVRINKPKESQRSLAIRKGTTRRVKVGHNVMEILAPVTKLLTKLEKEGFLRIGNNSNMKYVPQAFTP